MTVRKEELPQRKVNRIGQYDYSQNGAYFITICTRDRERVLSDIVGDDAHIVPKPYGEIAEKYIRNVPEIEKFVIMPDHIHMLLRIDLVGEAFRLPEYGTGDPSPTLGNIVGWYKYQATKQINLLQNTPGNQLFQRSYYDHVIRNAQDYKEVWEYIENNPLARQMKKGKD